MIPFENNREYWDNAAQYHPLKRVNIDYRHFLFNRKHLILFSCRADLPQGGYWPSLLTDTTPIKVTNPETENSATFILFGAIRLPEATTFASRFDYICIEAPYKNLIKKLFVCMYDDKKIMMEEFGSLK